jgi:hypothetical protein
MRFHFWRCFVAWIALTCSVASAQEGWEAGGEFEGDNGTWKYERKTDKDGRPRIRFYFKPKATLDCHRVHLVQFVKAKVNGTPTSFSQISGVDHIDDDEVGGCAVDHQACEKDPWNTGADQQDKDAQPGIPGLTTARFGDSPSVSGLAAGVDCLEFEFHLSAYCVKADGSYTFLSAVTWTWKLCRGDGAATITPPSGEDTEPPDGTEPALEKFKETHRDEEGQLKCPDLPRQRE